MGFYRPLEHPSEFRKLAAAARRAPNDPHIVGSVYIDMTAAANQAIATCPLIPRPLPSPRAHAGPSHVRARSPTGNARKGPPLDETACSLGPEELRYFSISSVATTPA